MNCFVLFSMLTDLFMNFHIEFHIKKYSVDLGFSTIAVFAFIFCWPVSFRDWSFEIYKKGLQKAAMWFSFV